MKNKKGFTLIELLAVIVVLAIILVIAGSSVIGYINSSKENAKFIAAKEIVSMAEAYFAVNTDKTYVSVKTLVDEKYLESDVTNPVTGENISSSSIPEQYIINGNINKDVPRNEGYITEQISYIYDGDMLKKIKNKNNKDPNVPLIYDEETESFINYKEIDGGSIFPEKVEITTDNTEGCSNNVSNCGFLSSQKRMSASYKGSFVFFYFEIDNITNYNNISIDYKVSKNNNDIISKITFGTTNDISEKFLSKNLDENVEYVSSGVDSSTEKNISFDIPEDSKYFVVKLERGEDAAGKNISGYSAHAKIKKITLKG